MAPDPAAPPRPPVTARTAPFLKRVRIRNYKSIRSCDVALEPLTVFVGRNGSGKSNFFDALQFLSELMQGQLRRAVFRRGGWKQLLCRSAGRNQIDIELEATFDISTDRCDARYALRLEADAGRVFVADERLDLSGPAAGVRREQNYHAKAGTIQFAANGGPPFTAAGLDGPFLSVSAAELHEALAGLIRTSGRYAFEPSAMRPAQAGGSPPLDPNGANLAAAFRGLVENSPTFADVARHTLSAIVPQVRTCEPAVIDAGYETVRFDVWADEQRTAYSRFDSPAVSDGTLIALATLVAAYQVLPTGRPGFVAIEEPENGLHPAAAHILMAAFDEAALSTQVLISTHSPDLLDSEEVTPERVRVVEFVDGETVVGPVGKAGVSVVRDHLNTFGGLESEDRLTVDRADLTRQRAAENGAAK